MLVTQGAHTKLLRSTNDPWKVTATLVKGAGSNANAVLQGETVRPFINGWANFTDLAISLAGSGYKIRFTVSNLILHISKFIFIFTCVFA